MMRVEGESPAGSGFVPRSRPQGSARPWAVSAAAAAIALSGALAYRASLRGAFVYDDLHNLVDNPHLARLFPPGGRMWADPRFGLAGRPVASFTFALNHALGGLDPLGYHALNLAIHVSAALLLFGLVRRGLELGGGRFSGRAFPAALAVGLLWVVHPLTTAAVTYLYQRCESLMGAFLLATVYLGLRARSQGQQGSAGRRLACGAVACCWLGAGCKETMVVAPLLMLLVDRCLVAGTLRGALVAAPRMYAGLFASWVLIALLVVESGARADSVGFGFESVTPWDYLRSQAKGLVLYARLCLWPAELVFDYGRPVPRGPGDWVPQGLAVLAALGLTARGLARNRPAALLGAWFFLILAPSSSVLPIVTEVWVEHRVYLPLAAVLLALVLGAVRLLGTGAAARVLLLAAVLALGARTHRRNLDYESEQTLWSKTVEQVPENARAHYALGDALLRGGSREQALARFEQAVRLDPLDPFLRLNPGVLALELGQPELGRAHLEQAVRLRPEWSLAQQALGSARLAAGELEGARAAFERALELAPDNFAAARGLAQTQARAGRPREALRLLEVVVRERPADAEALVELGELLLAVPERLRDPARALELAERAARLSDAERTRALLGRARAAAAGSPGVTPGG